MYMLYGAREGTVEEKNMQGLIRSHGLVIRSNELIIRSNKLIVLTHAEQLRLNFVEIKKLQP